MPYINDAGRERMMYEWAKNAGELNYEITTLISRYWNQTKNYQGINDIVGALVSAKDEFTRRIVIPYEDKKIKENGDVY